MKLRLVMTDRRYIKQEMRPFGRSATSRTYSPPSKIQEKVLRRSEILFIRRGGMSIFRRGISIFRVGVTSVAEILNVIAEVTFWDFLSVTCRVKPLMTSRRSHLSRRRLHMHFSAGKTSASAV